MDADSDRLRDDISLVGENIPAPEKISFQLDPEATPRLRTHVRARQLASASICAVLGVGFFATTGPAGAGAVAPTARSEVGGAAMISWAQFVACQDAIVKGKIRKVKSPPRARLATLTVDVRDWLKPRSGPKSAKIKVKAGEGNTPFRIGVPVLIAVPKVASDGSRPYASQWYDRKEIVRTTERIRDSLRESERLDCPDGWYRTY